MTILEKKYKGRWLIKGILKKKKKEKKLERKYDVRTLVVRKDANVRDLRIPHGNSIGGHSAADIQLL